MAWARIWISTLRGTPNAKTEPWITQFPASRPRTLPPVIDGHIIVVPKEHVPSMHALRIPVQKAVWALVSEVRGRLRTGLVPDGSFNIGFLDGLTAAQLVSHAVIHPAPGEGGRGGDRSPSGRNAVISCCFWSVVGNSS